MNIFNNIGARYNSPPDGLLNFDPLQNNRIQLFYYNNNIDKTVDINFDKNFLEGLTKVFPRMWFEKIEFIQSDSNSYFTKLDDNKSFDLIYIDGDHKYESVKSDWENSKNRFKKYILFDDYHLPTKKQKDIECAKVIDDIDNENKELIIMDRRIFLDDRQLSDDEIDYGQVLIKNDFELNFKNV